MYCGVFCLCVLEGLSKKYFRKCAASLREGELRKTHYMCGHRLLICIQKCPEGGLVQQADFLKGSSLLLPILSTCACSVFHHILILSFSQYLFSSYKESPPQLTFYFLFFQCLNSTLYSIPSFVSLASWSPCHPFFLIRLFVPCALLPGVSSSVSPSVRSGNGLL